MNRQRHSYDFELKRFYSQRESGRRLSESVEGENVEWLQKLSDEEYARGPH